MRFSNFKTNIKYSIHIKPFISLLTFSTNNIQNRTVHEIKQKIKNLSKFLKKKIQMHYTAKCITANKHSRQTYKLNNELNVLQRASLTKTVSLSL